MQVARYTNTAIILHWVIALGVVTNVTLAWLWPHMLPDDVVRPTIDVHKSIGITILGLALMRLLWRASHAPPPIPTTYQKWEISLAHITHVLLYVILFAMPLTGWIMDSAFKDAAKFPMHYFGTFVFPRIPWIMQLDQPLKENIHTWFGEAHEWLSYVLYVLFVLHVAGALKHQLAGDKELQRMLPGKREA
ncbi:MAG TPA: cytochrome b [Vitreimonas sp.]|jgi:cytochrome b561|nr:cytochrome b [Vitreimonas sp.]